MAISFDSISSTIRTPTQQAEFDSSRSAQGPSLVPYKALIIAQKTSAGTGVANSINRITNVSEAQVLGGRGSQAHRMAIAWFASNKSTELYLALLDDNAAGVLATKTATYAGTSTEAGTISLYVGGVLVQTACPSGTAAADLGPLVSASITANLDLPVTSGAVGAVVTTTARNRGVEGQDMDLRHNYQRGEKLPAGITCTIATGVSGITNPVLTTLIAALGDVQYHVIAHPYTDATSLSAIEAELTSRNLPARQIDGLAITSAPGSNSVLGSLGDTRNNRHSFIVSQPGETPITPPCEFASEYAAICAYHLAIDPARPVQTLAMVHAKPPATADLFTRAERNLMLYDGISTSLVAAGGVVQLERLVSTYQTNAAGAGDTAYLDGTVLAILMYLRPDWNARIASRYPRAKLMDDGGRIPKGQSIMTPALMKVEAVLWFNEKVDQGLLEAGSLAQFKADLITERNASDPNRMDVLLPPDLINFLAVTATKFQFLT